MTIAVDLGRKVTKQTNKRRSSPCADPGIFVRGGGGPGQSDKKKAPTTFFFFFFFCPQPTLQKSNGKGEVSYAPTEEFSSSFTW